MRNIELKREKGKYKNGDHLISNFYKTSSQKEEQL